MRSWMRRLAVAALVLSVVLAVGVVTLHPSDVAQEAQAGDVPVTTPQAPPEPSTTTTTIDLQAFADAATGWQLEQYAKAVEQAQARAKAAQKPATTGAGRQQTRPAPATPGNGSAEAFRQCVMVRESGRRYGSVGGGMYGIIDSTWRNYGFAARWGVAHSWLASPAQQDAAFWELFNRYGAEPWAPYDGCRL